MSPTASTSPTTGLDDATDHPTDTGRRHGPGAGGEDAWLPATNTVRPWPGVADPARLLTEIAGWLHGYGNRGTRRTYAEGLGLPVSPADLHEWVAAATSATASTAAASGDTAWAAALGHYAAAMGIDPTHVVSHAGRTRPAGHAPEHEWSGLPTGGEGAVAGSGAWSGGGVHARAAAGDGSDVPGGTGDADRPGPGERAGRGRRPPPAQRGRLRHVHWFRWCVARGIDPVDATAGDVKAWLDALADAGAAPATRDRMLGALKALYGCLADVGLVAGNPAALNRRRLGLAATGRTSSTVTLTTAQVAQLYRVAGERRPGVGELGAARARAVVALFTLGLRVSELCNLDRADLHVTRGRRALRVPGKGDKPRIVYLSVPADEALTAYLRLRDAARGSAGDAAGGTGGGVAGRTAAGAGAVVRGGGRRGHQVADTPLVATSGGARCTRQGVWHLLRRIARSTDGPLAQVADELHPHALRHFYVTTAVEAGAQLVHVQADVGHTSIDTTNQVYNSAARDPSRSAVDLVADAIHRT